MKKRENYNPNKPRKPLRNPSLPHPAWKWAYRITVFISVLYAIFVIYWFYLYFTGQINPQ